MQSNCFDVVEYLFSIRLIGMEDILWTDRRSYLSFSLITDFSLNYLTMECNFLKCYCMRKRD